MLVTVKFFDWTQQQDMLSKVKVDHLDMVPVAINKARPYLGIISNYEILDISCE